MGCGGIGGTVAAHLLEIGADVTAVTTNTGIADAVARRGFRLRGDGDARDVPGRIHVGIPPGAGPFDFALLATQPPQVEAAAATALPHLADDGALVCFQNGLCELRVAELAGPDRVIGAVVAWGASMPEPGLYDRTAPGGFTIGRLDGPPDDRALEIGRLLEAVGPVAYTSNLLGTRWSKLAINAAISSLGTLAGERLGPLVRVRRYRRLCLEVMTEVVAVAAAEGVSLEKVSGTIDLDWIALTDAERRARTGTPSLAAKHALLVAVGMRYRRLRSSMLSAIERGRPPAIDFLNGEVVARARSHGIDTPLNARIVDAVWALARGQARPSRTLLDRLYADTRAATA
ncbi:MAG: ketopantoate reductase family protein [Deltaproteobacteria bacterium]|nr:MAG: ketopantoate reductase family protein [Deltaproteobacteria bacterium]